MTYKAKIDSNRIFGDDSLSNEEIIEKCKEREARNFGICAYLYYYPDYCSADSITIPFPMELTEISIDESPNQEV